MLENHRNVRLMLAIVLFGSIRLSHNDLGAVKEMQDSAWPIFSYRLFSHDYKPIFSSIKVIKMNEMLHANFYFNITAVLKIVRATVIQIALASI